MGVKLGLSLIEVHNRVKKNQLDAKLILGIFRQPIQRISCASSFFTQIYRDATVNKT